jgi:hypothetical protein
MKIYNYALLSISIMVVLNVLGFQFTASSWALHTLGLSDLSNIRTSSFVVSLFAILGITIAGAAIGTFFNISPQFAIKGAWLVGTLSLLIGDLISILVYPNIDSWVKVLLSIIILPLIGAFFIALKEDWENRD